MSVTHTPEGYVVALPGYTPPQYRNSTGMSSETLTYRVDGMTCDHCKAAVNEEVSKVPGVESIEIDLDTKLVRVSGDSVDHDAVVAAIDEAGYDAEPAA
jgi:copper chaperone